MRTISRERTASTGVVALLVLTALLLLPSMLFADTITLDNGDVLTGTVVRASGGVLRFSTDYSKEISISMSKAVSLKTDTPAVVVTGDGITLKGIITTSEDGSVSISGVDIETHLSSISEIASINPPPVRWSGVLTAGGSLSGGNTEGLNVSVGLDASRKSGGTTTALGLLYNYAEDENGVSARNAFGSLRYEAALSDRAYGLFTLEALSDEFRGLDLRAAAGPGLGYKSAGENPYGCEFGVSYIHEDKSEGGSDGSAALRVSGFFGLGLPGGLGFRERLVLYADAGELDNTRTRNEASVSAKVSAVWAVRLVNVIEHDSDPPEGIRETDVSWNLGIQRSF